MIPCLYNYDETEYTTNGIGKLSDAITCVVTEKRNSPYMSGGRCDGSV